MRRKPLRIGNLEFEYPFVLAPLAGITDSSMRSLCSQAGASLTYTEMVSAKGLWYGDRKTAELLRIDPSEGSVGYQLFGSEPLILAHAVRTLQEMPVDGKPESRIPGPPPKPWPGYDNDRRPVLFDLNAGCPVPKIVRNGEGSALLKDIRLLHDVVAAMTRVASVPVTVKIRKGFAAGDDCAAETARAAEAAGAAAITIHGRTREQYYSGTADWSAIAAVKKAVKIPVIGNGDVMSGADAIRMMEETGCDGVMIARGALGNPWIFRDACALWRGEECPPAPETDERIRMLTRHIDLVCADKGERVAVREMRKFVGWYTKGMRGAAQVRRRVNTIENAGEMKQALEELITG